MLNVTTNKDQYLLPFIVQILDLVANYERYSVCDGFFWLLSTKDCSKVSKENIFYYKKVLFLLYNVTKWIKKFSISLSKERKLALFLFIGSFVKDFFDDSSVYNTQDENSDKLQMILEHYDEHGVQLITKKYFSMQLRVKILGHMELQDEIEADLDKVKAIILLWFPKNTK